MLCSETTTIKDFLIEKQIGLGSYGKIVLAKHKASGALYAIKMVSRRNVQKSKRLETANIEKRCLESIDSQYVVKLYGYFEDPLCFNFVLEYVEGGDMFTLRHELVPQLPHIFKQVVSSLAYLHSHKIIHRDIKLENILVDHNNNIKLCDFGSAKICEEETSTFCRSSYIGSADYTAPEILNKQDICHALDLWDLGIAIYAAYNGHGPFYSLNRLQVFDNIRNCKYAMVETIPGAAQDLISKLLKLDPKERLGYNDFSTGYSTILSHPYFN
ncbi:AGC family protein kinase [Trichomonas vaginalis G3]|uniref:non-specific serine/threonine protein kinase n=1 Tax=Trichomonas vaginalis (strain ATCC PRA-98 / G3) TaxID=412133 RepID=A2DYS1_TRIV3|nr:cAMP-dependent protein kinase protein [Trichomonas vaginalis G3]EAY14461.1 AGC family protein kinase [Trichomonas vaginalis G3]KAI5519641.1 cAMP-dependent protein kinase protein [Trichomonas vaginalis G3]|eukprot:XP_001326684.1 AGC family protein kinase [Trichomonas vaginalis G3]